MKKIILSVTLVAILMLTLGGSVLAVEGPPECIKMRADVTLDNVQTGVSSFEPKITFSKGVVVGTGALEDDNCKFGAISDVCDNNITSGACYLYQGKAFGVLAALNTIYNVTNWVFYIMMTLAVLMIIYGGFLYITAAGDPEKAGKGKTVLTLSIIGIVIALIARLVPSAVRFIMGM